MTKNVLRTTTINAPVERVFSFLSDPTNWMAAFPGDSEVTYLEIKPDGVGTSARWSAKMFGIPMTVTHEYREVVPNKRIESRASVGPVLSFSLEPVNSGTELTLEESMDIPAPVVRVPVQALFARWAESDVQGMAANIKSLIETGEKTVTETNGKKVTQTLTWSDGITILAPVREVFNLVKDPRVWLGKDVHVSGLKTTPEGVGTTFEASWKILGMPLKTTHEYIEFVPDRYFTSKAAMGPVFRVEVAPATGGPGSPCART